MGERAPGASCSRRPIRARSPQLLAATTEGDALLVDQHGAFPLRAPADLPQILDGAGGRGPALEAAAAARARGLSRSIDETRTADSPRAGLVSASSSGWSPARRVVQGRDRATSRDKIDPSGEVARRRQPGAGERSASGCASSGRGCAARSSRILRGKDTAKYLQDQVVTERNGRYVLVVQGRASQRRFPASSTARRRAAPACSSSRSARSRSTTTSSRSRSRRPRRSAASCWR